MKIVAKTVSYSLVHVFVAFFVAWGVSGDIGIALGISLIEPAFQIAFFYFHEHAWHRIEKKKGKVTVKWDGTPPCCKATAEMIRQHRESGGCATTTDQ